jgi:AbrB family looped-hinge helix DNA binding protein
MKIGDWHATRALNDIQSMAIGILSTPERACGGRMGAMMVNIDRAGRVVIPKELRDRFAIDAETPLEVTADGDGIRLTPRRSLGRAVIEDDGWPVFERVEGTTITDADVQRWRDADQR